MAYTEQPAQRNIAQLTTGQQVEYFEFSETGTDPWTKEVQYIETDDTSPSGFWVYWRPYTIISEFTTQTLPQFIAASFPRKPGIRGGTPPNA